MTASNITRRNRGVGNTPEKRFWSRVAITPDDTECWNWQGCFHANGYGAIKIRKYTTMSHRVAWILANGRMTTLQVLHSCDNRACCNPKHLREGTQLDNMRDAIQRKRKAYGRQSNSNALDIDTVQRIRIFFAQGYSRQAIMRIEEVSYRPVRDIDTGRNWKWID